MTADYQLGDHAGLYSSVGRNHRASGIISWVPHVIHTLGHHPVTTGLICGGAGGIVAVHMVLIFDPYRGWEWLTGHARPGFWRKFWVHFRWMAIGAVVGVVAVGMTFVAAWLTGLIAGAMGPPAAQRLQPELAEWVYYRRNVQRQAAGRHAAESRVAESRVAEKQSH